MKEVTSCRFITRNVVHGRKTIPVPIPQGDTVVQCILFCVKFIPHRFAHAKAVQRWIIDNLNSLLVNEFINRIGKSK